MSVATGGEIILYCIRDSPYKANMGGEHENDLSLPPMARWKEPWLTAGWVALEAAVLGLEWSAPAPPTLRTRSHRDLYDAFGDTGTTLLL